MKALRCCCSLTLPNSLRLARGPLLPSLYVVMYESAEMLSGSSGTAISNLL